jgi:hypothetical protein
MIDTLTHLVGQMEAGIFILAYYHPLACSLVTISFTILAVISECYVPRHARRSPLADTRLSRVRGDQHVTPIHQIFKSKRGPI